MGQSSTLYRRIPPESTLIQHPSGMNLFWYSFCPKFAELRVEND